VRLPSSAKIDVILNDSLDPDIISFSALELADFINLSNCTAVGEGMKLRIPIASDTFLPRIKSIRGLTFLTDTPVFLIFDVVGI
jgi:hypothetical protein